MLFRQFRMGVLSSLNTLRIDIRALSERVSELRRAAGSALSVGYQNRNAIKRLKNRLRNTEQALASLRSQLHHPVSGYVSMLLVLGARVKEIEERLEGTGPPPSKASPSRGLADESGTVQYTDMDGDTIAVTRHTSGDVYFFCQRADIAHGYSSVMLTANQTRNLVAQLTA